MISPELADVLSAIVRRIRGTAPAVPLVVSYDKNERVDNRPWRCCSGGHAYWRTGPSARHPCGTTLDHALGHLDQMIARLDAQIEAMMAPFRAQRDLLITIPGIGPLAASPHPLVPAAARRLA